MSAKAYWFYLESYVYVAIKGHDVLLYNAMTGKFLSYTRKPQIVEFLRALHRKENLYALEVTPGFLKENRLESFMEDISGYFMGDLIDVSLAPGKPFFMSPHFDIREEDNPMEKRVLKNVGKDSLFAVTHLTLFVNSRCRNNCPACHTACKQFPWCTRGNGNNKNNGADSLLEIGEIKEILDQTKGCPIKTIDIIGGDLTLYPYLERLVELLCSGSYHVNYHFHFSHLKDRIPDVIPAGGPNTRATLLVDCSTITSPGDLNRLKRLEPDRVIFLIQKDPEISIVESVIDHISTPDITVQPYFNGRNLDFFKANVFTDVQSLAESIPDLGAVNSRKSYNTMNYGKIFIKSNKEIISGLNGAPLGKINEVSIEEAVVSELSQHGNWLKTRHDVAPCGDCLLNSICPPLSDFENATGINNSCNIWKERTA